MRKGLTKLGLAAVALALAACQAESYDSGDDKYSYLRADFGMLQTGQSREAVSFTSDEGQSVVFPQKVAVAWATTADSTYRSLVYYDVSTSRPFIISPVIVVKSIDMSSLKPATADSVNALRDPFTVESGWRSGHYLNIAFAVKTGKADTLATAQRIGLCLDSVTTDAQGRRHRFMHILHSQNGQPEYYSVHTYMSLPVPDSLASDVLHVSASTYGGPWQRTY